jgi:hypothetical protein
VAELPIRLRCAALPPRYPRPGQLRQVRWSLELKTGQTLIPSQPGSVGGLWVMPVPNSEGVYAFDPVHESLTSESRECSQLLRVRHGGRGGGADVLRRGAGEFPA